MRELAELLKTLPPDAWVVVNHGEYHASGVRELNDYGTGIPVVDLTVDLGFPDGFWVEWYAARKAAK